ncbi:hypothetical protein ACWGOK_40825 [Streptomyces eurythermus]
MSDHLSSEDVSAMRREGDFRAFLRQVVKSGQQNFQQTLRPAAPTTPVSLDHIPGAWPIAPADSSGEEASRTTCSCGTCRSYAEDQPEQ